MSADVKTPAGRTAILAVCEAATPGPWMSGLFPDEPLVDARFIALARTALPEAIEYIERLERELGYVIEQHPCCRFRLDAALGKDGDQ